MIGKFLFFLSICLLFSCRDEVSGFNSKDNLIPRDTLVMVLKEMTLLESHVQSKYIQVNRYHKTMKKSGDLILKNYHISPSRYEESMDYYGSHQEEMQSIYAQVLDSLNRISNQLVVNDSIHNLDNSDQNKPVGFIKKRINK